MSFEKISCHFGTWQSEQEASTAVVTQCSQQLIERTDSSAKSNSSFPYITHTRNCLCFLHLTAYTQQQEETSQNIFFVCVCLFSPQCFSLELLFECVGPLQYRWLIIKHSPNARWTSICSGLGWRQCHSRFSILDMNLGQERNEALVHWVIWTPISAILWEVVTLSTAKVIWNLFCQMSWAKRPDKALGAIGVLFSITRPWWSHQQVE